MVRLKYTHITNRLQLAFILCETVLHLLIINYLRCLKFAVKIIYFKKQNTVNKQFSF